LLVNKYSNENADFDFFAYTLFFVHRYSRTLPPENGAKDANLDTIEAWLQHPTRAEAWFRRQIGLNRTHAYDLFDIFHTESFLLRHTLSHSMRLVYEQINDMFKLFSFNVRNNDDVQDFEVNDKQSYDIDDAIETVSDDGDDDDDDDDDDAVVVDVDVIAGEAAPSSSSAAVKRQPKKKKPEPETAIEKQNREMRERELWKKKKRIAQFTNRSFEEMHPDFQTMCHCWTRDELLQMRKEKKNMHSQTFIDAFKRYIIHMSLGDINDLANRTHIESDEKSFFKVLDYSFQHSTHNASYHKIVYFFNQIVLEMIHFLKIGSDAYPNPYADDALIPANVYEPQDVLFKKLQILSGHPSISTVISRLQTIPYHAMMSIDNLGKECESVIHQSKPPSLLEIPTNILKPAPIIKTPVQQMRKKSDGEEGVASVPIKKRDPKAEALRQKEKDAKAEALRQYKKDADEKQKNQSSHVTGAAAEKAPVASAAEKTTLTKEQRLELKLKSIAPQTVTLMEED